MSKRKLLVLGGKPIGSCELVRAAQDQGFYVVVADYLPVAASPAKQIADASWELSTADLGALKQRCIEERIDGVLSGVHEFNLRKMAALSEMLELPCYCTEAQQICAMISLVLRKLVVKLALLFQVNILKLKHTTCLFQPILLQ